MKRFTVTIKGEVPDDTDDEWLNAAAHEASQQFTDRDLIFNREVVVNGVDMLSEEDGVAADTVLLTYGWDEG